MRVKDPGQIRRWRKRCNYSQRELAFLCKKSQNAISLVEKGDLKNITEDFAVALAGRLGVPWEDLFEAHAIEARSTVASAVCSVGEKVPA
ncbi:helix-turn-helix domain-containing protein [Rhodococcus sp. T9N]|uniref:helix-turn-helix domain-containing protein n=1 Tax=Rhodococcus sp. T9N TaxID=627445 RepID=UPI0021C416EF|nr:helix-turn-helix transcriptional regulator [Rhodococcus sp. T9N]